MTTAMNTIERMKRMKERHPASGNQNHMKGIYHAWKDGDNIIRLAGSFIEVRTHFIAPAPKRKDRGLCRQDVFEKGENALPMVVNCLDWDVEKEEPKSIKTCPFCKLAEISRAILKDNPTEEDKKFAKSLNQSAYPRSNLKWNIIDRDDPYIVITEGETEKKVLGFKIATIGMEAWKCIEGIFEQCKRDISDPSVGIDIKVTKASNGTRMAYTAQAVIDGTSVRVTPFSPEEASMPMHDLKVRCGKVYDAQRLIDAMHEDLMELYRLNITDSDPAVEDEAVAADVSASEESSFDDGGLSSVATQTETVEGDGDGLMDTPPVETPAPAPAPVAKQAPVASKPVAPATRPVAAPTVARPSAPVSAIRKPGAPAPVAQKKT